MNFTDYSDCAVDTGVELANATGDTLATPSDLRALFERHDRPVRGRITAADVRAAREMGARLRRVLTAPDSATAARLLNTLLAECGTQPYLTDHDGEPLHFHFSAPDAPLAVRLGAEAAMGLAVVLRDAGLERFATCAAPDCDDVFVDTSRNRSRRYCSAATCGNRAHVAAYRARRRRGKDPAAAAGS